VRNLIFLILAVGLIAFYYFSTPPSNPEWLYGKWSIKTKKADSKIENLTFYQDGKMVFGNSRRVVYKDCTFDFYNKTTIDFECIIKGKKAIFPLKVSNGNRTITTTNGNTFEKDI